MILDLFNKKIDYLQHKSGWKNLWQSKNIDANLIMAIIDVYKYELLSSELYLDSTCYNKGYNPLLPTEVCTGPAPFIAISPINGKA